MKGPLTVTEAAKVAGLNRRTFSRWLQHKAPLFPGLLTRLGTGSRAKILIDRRLLADALGLDSTDVETALERHGTEIDALKRRVRDLEQKLNDAVKQIAELRHRC